MPDRATEAGLSTRAGVREDFAGLTDAFERAEGRNGSTSRDLVVAGFRVRLRAAGPALLEELWPAFAHLTPTEGDGRSNGEADTRPDLTIQLWDTASTGVGLPEIPWVAEADDGLRGNVVAHEHDIRMVYRPFEGEFVGLDARRDLAVMWVPDHSAVSVHVRGAPFLVIWHWWLRAFGVHPVHAAAVGERAGGILLVGRGGSGKSTTSLACALDGMLFASDDYVLLQPGPEPLITNLFGTAKVAPTDAARFPQLDPAVRRWGAPDEKVLVYVNGFMPDRVARGFPLRAVVCPKVVPASETRLVPIRPAQALAALAPSTLLQLPIPDPMAFGAMADVVRRVPSFALELGTDLSTIPRAVRGLLEAV